MAIISSDWTVTRSNGNIRYIGNDHGGGSPSYSSVIDFHRWLQSLADDAVAIGDDELDITNTDPSRRSTDNIITLINGYNITSVESEHLYDGSIIQGTIGVDQKIWDGIVNFGNLDIQIQIIQNGSILTDDWWNFNGGGLNPDVTNGISHRFMILVHDYVGSGGDIDNRKLIGISRRFNHTYGEFVINSTSRGNNVFALSDGLDLNNTTSETIVSGWTGITNLNQGYVSLDVNNDGVPEYYYSQWDRDVYSINQFFERLKWLTRDGSTSTIYGINGELFRGITHQITITQLGGTFVEPESISWTGGTGQLLAINSTSSGTLMWIQLLTGSIPSAQTITGNGGATATSGTVTTRDISKPFVGVSTGTALIGSYGLSLQVSDLTSNDKVTSLSNTVVSPPNYVTNTVAGISSGVDRVLVAPWNGSSYDTNGDPIINKGQFLLDSGLTTNNITTVVIKTGNEVAIPSDTPATGYIRVTDNNGFERRLHFSSWSGTTFTIDTTDGNEDFNSVNANINNNVYIAYIDELATGTTATFVSVQSGTRDLVVLVRNGGTGPIKQFISTWSQTSSNSTISAIRTTDV